MLLTSWSVHIQPGKIVLQYFTASQRAEWLLQIPVDSKCELFHSLVFKYDD